MAIELDTHQIEAVNKLGNGKILCGVVGSGKSRCALAYYFCRECRGKIPINGKGEYVKPDNLKPLYIITTARKRDTFEWEKECVPFLLHDDVHVDSWNNISKYINVTDAFFIFDEQRVIGYGVWARSFIKIARRNHWILLSGTPGDTWMDYMSVFIANGFFKHKTDFCNQHVVYKKFSKFPNQIDYYIFEDRLERLRDSILVDIEYTKPAVSHSETIYVGYDKVLYRTVRKNRWNIYKDEPIQNISELCYILRQIINTDESRASAVLRITDQKDKVIIFYNYNCELELLKELPYGDDCCVAEWNGDKHQPIPDSQRWVYLVQYAAGAEGWNCIETDTIIFFSQNYSYKIMQQAAGRIDRRNTPFADLYYYHLKSKAPIDKAISVALKEKRNFNEKRFISK